MLNSILQLNNTTGNGDYMDNHKVDYSIQNNSLIVNMENTIGRAKHDYTFNYQFRNSKELLSSQSYDDLPRMVQRDICNPKQDGVLTPERISEINTLRHEVLVFVMSSILNLCDDRDDKSDTNTDV